jgi:hypothetical protein
MQLPMIPLLSDLSFDPSEYGPLNTLLSDPLSNFLRVHTLLPIRNSR